LTTNASLFFLHQHWAEVQLFSAIHDRARLGDDDFVVEAVFPQQLFADDLVAIARQPLAELALTAIGLQYQPRDAAKALLAA